MKTLYDFLIEAIEHKIAGQIGSATTQVATTGGSFEKSGAELKDKIPDNGRVLNYGAGLDHTTEALKKGLGGKDSKHKVEDYEPFPERRKSKPTYIKSEDIPTDSHHAVVCHNVVNVVDRETRDHIMHHIFSTTKEGGHIHIIARKFKGDVDGAKNARPGNEKGSLLIKKGSQEVYQKGFDGSELSDYVKDLAEKHGHKVEVSKLGFGASGVKIKMIKKNKE